MGTRSCRTLVEAQEPGYRLQHLLSRARLDHDRVREEIAGPAVRELAGQEVVLAADETGGTKSSCGCKGVGPQYSGALEGVGLRQVAAHLAVVTESVRVLTDRALHLLGDRPADDERREAADVPEEIMFATKPQQTAAWSRTHSSRS